MRLPKVLLISACLLGVCCAAPLLMQTLWWEFGVERREHSRHVNPSASLEAVVKLENPGAFSSYIESIEIRRRGDRGGPVVIRGKHLAVHPTWVTDDHLRIVTDREANLWESVSTVEVDGRQSQNRDRAVGA